MMKATYRRRSGWADCEIEPQAVTILGFVEATIEPGYMRHGSKRCVVAIVYGDDGKLMQAELSDLSILNGVPPERPKNAKKYDE